MGERDRAADGEAQTSGERGFRGRRRGERRDRDEEGLLRTASQRSETVDYDNSCPTCFEAYEEENPRITLACGHHFHLACILSWQEYSAATSRERGCPGVRRAD